MWDLKTTEVATLQTTCNKYNPGKQVFKLQSIMGLKNNTNKIETTPLSKIKLLNKDTSNIPITEASTASVIKLDVPKAIVMDYPYKFIPPGTRVIVSFNSGDITKPVIVGAEF